MLQDSIRKAVDTLDLMLPYKITIKAKAHDKHTACYTARYRNRKLYLHDITVYLENILGNHNERSLDTLIVHELIHAWQEEHGFTDIHGDSFQSAAEILSKSIGMIYLYCPDLDKDPALD